MVVVVVLVLVVVVVVKECGMKAVQVVPIKRTLVSTPQWNAVVTIRKGMGSRTLL